ncbi:MULTISPECIES: CRISPR-associated protein Cas4 [Caldisericum]|uniref:CRISPR-associated exonuclease Cas4 n=1 Tax=Caldisericum exile TaxID=693075 RepID=A0A2J6WF06_9BACT|nr:MAG: CRISPR-associated protein Cas4 [Caldisericum exile]
MVDDFKITGTLIQSYLICKRQAWFHIHKIIPFQDHPLLEIGRLIDEYSYERDLKRIILDNVQIDFVRGKNGDLLVGEVKKSSKAKEIAKMQLLFYLWVLEEKGIKAKGVLSFPTERRREFLELKETERRKIFDIIEGINDIAIMENAPSFKKIPFCKNCAYKEFCFA